MAHEERKKTKIYIYILRLKKYIYIYIPTLSCYSDRNCVVQSRPPSCNDADGLFAWVASLRAVLSQDASPYRAVLSQDASPYRNIPFWRSTHTLFPRPTPTCTQPPSTGTSSSRLSSYRVGGRNLAPFPVVSCQNKILEKYAYLCVSISHTKSVRRLLSIFLKFTSYVTVTAHQLRLTFWRRNYFFYFNTPCT